VRQAGQGRSQFFGLTFTLALGSLSLGLLFDAPLGKRGLADVGLVRIHRQVQRALPALAVDKDSAAARLDGDGEHPREPVDGLHVDGATKRPAHQLSGVIQIGAGVIPDVLRHNFLLEQPLWPPASVGTCR